MASSLTYIFCMFDSMISGYLTDLERDAPPRASQFLEIVKSLAGSTSPPNKPANPESNHLFIYLTASLYFPLPKMPPRPDTRQQETTTIAWSPWELFKLANTKLFTLPCLTLPMENPRKALAQIFPSLLSSATWPRPDPSHMTPLSDLSPSKPPSFVLLLSYHIQHQHS